MNKINQQHPDFFFLPGSEIEGLLILTLEERIISAPSSANFALCFFRSRLETSIKTSWTLLLSSALADVSFALQERAKKIGIELNF